MSLDYYLAKAIRMKAYYWQTDFFFGLQVFFHVFKKTEMNKAQKTSIWPTMHFRDDIFDSFLSSCTTYDE